MLFRSGENHSRVSSELAGVHQQAEDEFKHTIAASADVVMRVRQLDRHAELSGGPRTAGASPK